MNLSPFLRQRFLDNSGLPLSGGQLFSYAAGTTTPQATYSNATGTTNTNPVVLDSSGYADVWLDPTLAYKFVLEDASNNVLWTVDNVTYPVGITTWNANTVYSQGSLVVDSSGQGQIYVSLTNNNQGNALTNVSAWRVYSGNTRSVSVSSTLLVSDDYVRSNSTGSSVTHTLPPCSTTPIGKRIAIKDIGTGGNTTSVKGSGTDLIDGSNTWGVAMQSLNSAIFENNGTSYDVYGVPSVGGVVTAQIANLAVTQGKIALQAVSGAQIASGSVGQLQLAAPVAFSGTTTASTVLTSTYAKIAFATSYDSNSGWASTTYTVPSAGVYSIHADIPLFTNTAGGGNAFISVFKGSTLLTTSYTSLLTSGWAVTASISYTGNFALNDTLSIQMQSTSGAIQLTGSTAGAIAVLTIVKSGP